MRPFPLVFTLALCLVLTGPGPRPAAGRLLRVLTCEEPPTNYLEDGRITGVSTDIVTAILNRANLEGAFQLLPWPRAYAIALAEPDVLLYTAGRTAEREDLFWWVGPLYDKHWVLYGRADDTPTIHSLAEARQVRAIAVLRTDARAQLLHRWGFTNLVEVDSHRQALEMLLAGRADLWPSSRMEAPFVAARNHIDPARLREVLPLKVIQPHLAVSRRTEPALVKRLQDGWHTLVDDGGLQEIANRWSRRLGTEIVVRDQRLLFTGRPVERGRP